MKKTKIVVWKDGTYIYVEDGSTFEYENDKDWLVTIPLTHHNIIKL